MNNNKKLVLLPLHDQECLTNSATTIFVDVYLLSVSNCVLTNCCNYQSFNTKILINSSHSRIVVQTLDVQTLDYTYKNMKLIIVMAGVINQ